jgi:hypothetical protein
MRYSTMVTNDEYERCEMKRSWPITIIYPAISWIAWGKRRNISFRIAGLRTKVLNGVSRSWIRKAKSRTQTFRSTIFLQGQFNIILQSIPKCYKWSLSFMESNKNCVHFPHVSYATRLSSVAQFKLKVHNCEGSVQIIYETTYDCSF